MTAIETVWIDPDTWYASPNPNAAEYTRTDLTIRRDDPVLKQVMEALHYLLTFADDDLASAVSGWDALAALRELMGDE